MEAKLWLKWESICKNGALRIPWGHDRTSQPQFVKPQLKATGGIP
jgi:hypothetical protein